MGRLERVRARLAGPHMPRFAAALVSLLLVPTLFMGLSGDDYSHWLRARGELPYGSRYDVFDFVDGTRDTFEFLKSAGTISWWGLERVQIRFFRPLTSLTHVIDYNVWPGAPWLMHAENLVLSAALVAFAAIFYRRLLTTPWIAGLAAVLYAIEPGHGMVGWIAFRNGVFAPALGVLTLIAHDRWRRDRWAAGRVLGPALFGLALCAGEAALATLAYIVAHAATLDGGKRAARVGAVLPYATIAGAWQVVYRLGGYGVVGSGIYLDPGREPLRFLAEAPVHAAALLIGQLAAPPADVIVFLSPSGKLVLLAAGIALLAFFAWLVAPLVARDPTSRFFALGAALALAPICATIPSNRLLFFVSLGAIGLVAQLTGTLVERAVDALASRARAVATRAFVTLWLVTHALLGPAAFIANSLAFPALEAFFQARSRELPMPAELTGRTVVIVNAPDLVTSVYRFMIPRDGRFYGGAHGLILSLTYGVVHVTRTGPRTLAVRSDDDMTAVPLASLFRGDTYPVRQGEEFHAGSARIHVDAVAPNGHPKAATFELEALLEDPRFFWITWDHGRFVAFTPPRDGEDVVTGN